jgi:hypothetical protein
VSQGTIFVPFLSFLPLIIGERYSSNHFSPFAGEHPDGHATALCTTLSICPSRKQRGGTSIATSQEQITRSVDQLAASLEQMTREIAKLQAVEQYVLYKNSDPPPRPAPAQVPKPVPRPAQAPTAR